MILADAWEASIGVGGLLIGVGTLIVAIVMASKKQDVKVTPQPLVVKPDDEYAHKRELDRVERAVTALAQERKDDTGKLHEKINAVDRKVAGLEQSTVLQNQYLAQMNTKLDRIIENRLVENGGKKKSE